VSHHEGVEHYSYPELVLYMRNVTIYKYVAHVKADFFSVEFTADFWYLSVVSGAKRTPIKTSNNYL
jgi:hypothetical protein